MRGQWRISSNCGRRYWGPEQNLFSPSFLLPASSFSLAVAICVSKDHDLPDVPAILSSHRHSPRYWQRLPLLSCSTVLHDPLLFQILETAPLLIPLVLKMDNLVAIYTRLLYFLCDSPTSTAYKKSFVNIPSSNYPNLGMPPVFFLWV